LNYQNQVLYDARGNGDGRVCHTLTGDHENRVTDYTAITAYIQPSFGEFQKSEKATTLKASDGKRVDPGAVVLEKGRPPRKYIVRRLTPLECCRLQGFPDWWVDGTEGSDSAIYKMWGNGIALPCAFDVLDRIAEAHNEETIQEGGAGSAKEGSVDINQTKMG
jgi:DNA (cytosine-5)-methyltransferase 1